MGIEKSHKLPDTVIFTVSFDCRRGCGSVDGTVSKWDIVKNPTFVEVSTQCPKCHARHFVEICS